MKYLIWGTGRMAADLLREQFLGYFRRHQIVAFVDNDSAKWGKSFFDRPVISPEKMTEYEWDYVAIACGYEQDIREQLREQLEIDELKITTSWQILREYSDELVKKLENRKVLFVGGDEDCVSAGVCRFKDIVNICGYVDIKSLHLIKNISYDYIIVMNLRTTPLYLERKAGNIKLQGDLINILINDFGIESEKIIVEDEVRLIRKYCIKKVCLGKENADKHFLVIKFNSILGLAIVVNVVLSISAWTKEHNYIPVVDWTDGNMYLTDNERGKMNAWEKFFVQPAGISLQQIKYSKNVYIVAHNNMDVHSISSADYYTLKVQPWLRDEAEQYCESLFANSNRSLGVLFRGTDYANKKEYGHMIQPDIYEMIRTVKEKLIQWGNFDIIYLCTEVEEAVGYFKNEFGDMVRCYPQKRVSENYSGYLANYKFDSGYDPYRRGADYYIALKALSMCNCLIAGECAGTVLAVGLNQNRYENVFRFNLGRYGIDDICESFLK